MAYGIKSEISTIIKKKINNNSFYYCHIEYEKIKIFNLLIENQLADMFGLATPLVFNCLMIKKTKITIKVLLPLFLFSNISSQILINSNFLKRIKKEHENIQQSTKKNNPIDIIFSQKLYINSNLPNLENLNGIYIPKGYGSYSSLIAINLNKTIITFEPLAQSRVSLPISVPKNKMFSVLNDVPLNNSSINNLSHLRNAGIKYKNRFVELGYGNWNRWWGPGMHNSLLISNNSLGFYHFL